MPFPLKKKFARTDRVKPIWPSDYRQAGHKNRCFGHFDRICHFRWLYLAIIVKRHIYRPRPFICAYSQVSTAIHCKDTAWKRIDDGQTDEHPESIGPQPLGLGPKKSQILGIFGQLPVAESVKRHIYTPRPFI